MKRFALCLATFVASAVVAQNDVADSRAAHPDRAVAQRIDRLHDRTAHRGAAHDHAAHRRSEYRGTAPDRAAHRSAAPACDRTFAHPADRTCDSLAALRGAMSARDGSFFRYPALRYSVVHMREFLPTVNVARNNRVPLSRFARDLDTGIDTVTFLPAGGSQRMTWRRSLDRNYTDGILVLHRGRIVYERYFGCLTEEGVHAVMSVTKSLTGLLAAMLVAEGRLEPSRPVTDYLPELAESGYGDATVREVMDMTTSIRYSEDYTDPAADVWRFGDAGNPLLEHPAGTPQGYHDYLRTLRREERHGRVFGYRTVNADVLGWIVERASGRSVAALLEERLWSRMGMEQDGYYLVDALGVPFAGGGFSAALRDLGRLGELLRCDGRWRGRQLLPAAAVADIRRGGDREAFARSPYGRTLTGWSYRDMWWVTHNDHGAFMARGVHGQAIYIDPAAEMVIVRLASNPQASNTANDPWSLPAYAAVADYLMRRP